MKGAGRVVGLALLIGSLVRPAPSGAQSTGFREIDASVESGWAFGLSGMVASWRKESDPFDWLGGPAVEVAWVAPRGVGFDARAGYQVPTGFYDMVGVWAHAMVTYSVRAGRHQMQLEGGASGLLGGDSDGTPWVVGGPLVGAGMLFRPTRRLGLRLDGFMQVLVVSGEWTTAPGLAAAVLMLPRGR